MRGLKDKVAVATGGRGDDLEASNGRRLVHDRFRRPSRWWLYRKVRTE